MGSFIVDANDGNTPVRHATRILTDALADTMMIRLGLMGAPGSGKPITVDRSLTGQAGEKVTTHFVPFADEQMILGQDIPSEGNEYRIDEFNQQVTLDEVKIPFRKKGNMTDQRTILRLREIFRRQIQQHITQDLEHQFFKRLAGFSRTDLQSGWESATDTTNRVASGGASTQGRCIRANGLSGYTLLTEEQSDNAALVAATGVNDRLNFNLILASGVMARKKAVYKMTPLRVMNGKEMYLLFVSDEAKIDLINDPDWFARALSLEASGLDDDPIATGSMGTVGNVIIHSSEHVKHIVQTAGSDEYARNILVGRDAMTLGYAQTLDYVEESFSYGEEMGVRGMEIRGEVKNAFTNKDDTSATVDYGVAQVITASNL